ncbi:MAG: bifunctional 4-hydroxy-2-oxoglutarate aldolase/2-dehydro-3-deoxy-phosphogluconate aldolase [Alphaproteobacteria bacterium]|nr:bifunctional 4-hydroxy-2-oxoglutarate aldolase/2-dehydro-3-deoxy-phosphogluconate aldolase [Alphaproteobacteria bacterium]
MNMLDIMKIGPAVPVVQIDEIVQAAPLAKALAKGGLKVVELTLRTECALDGVKAMQDAAPDLVVGMGTIRTPADVDRSLEAGAAFIVSPGCYPALLAAMKSSGAPALPGVATAGEAMAASAAGFSELKFFPAEAAGGVAFLKSLAAPLPDLTFCPTGGVKRETAGAYLALSNVACVGGGWIAPKALMSAGDWGAIEAHAWAAAKITPDISV